MSKMAIFIVPLKTVVDSTVMNMFCNVCDRASVQQTRMSWGWVALASVKVRNGTCRIVGHPERKFSIIN